MGRRALLALPLLAWAGCYQTEESDGTLVFRFETWVLLLVAFAGVALAAVGVVAVKSGASGRKVFVPFFLGSLALGIFLPSMAVDRVVVTPEEIRQTTGFWFVPTRKGFRYADVHSIRIEQRLTSKGVPNAIWVVRYKIGGTEALDPGDLWEKSSDTIIPRLREHGVDVQ